MIKQTAFAAGLLLLATSAPASIPPPFVWLSGQWWMSRPDGSWAEEVWSPLRGSGQMVGVAHAGDRPEATTSFEHMRIVREGDIYVYYGAPNGGPATAFRQIAGSQDCPQGSCEIVFANDAHDYPKRISYRLDDAAQLTATISGADPERDTMRWTYSKVWGAFSPPAPRARLSRDP